MTKSASLPGVIDPLIASSCELCTVNGVHLQGFIYADPLVGSPGLSVPTRARHHALKPTSGTIGPGLKSDPTAARIRLRLFIDPPTTICIPFRSSHRTKNAPGLGATRRFAFSSVGVLRPNGNPEDQNAEKQSDCRPPRAG